MDLTYKDKSYIRISLDFYLKHLKKYNEDADSMTEDEFSELQDDIVYLDKVLYEFEQEMAAEKENAGNKSNLYGFPEKK